MKHHHPVPLFHHYWSKTYRDYHEGLPLLDKFFYKLSQYMSS